MAINVDKLTAYVEEKRKPLILNAVIGAQSTQLLNLQTAVKGSAALNLLNTAVKFGDGSACGWDEAGTSELSQRVIEAKPVKINQSFCDKALLKTWMNYDVQVAAGQKTLPFAEDFVTGVVNGVKANLEKAIWQGDTASNDDNLNKFDGLVKIIEAAEIGATHTYAAGASVEDIIEAVYELIPAECYQKGEVAIFCGNDMYHKYILELSKRSGYLYAPEKDVEGKEAVKVPHTNVIVYGVDGLNNTGKVFASYKDNFVFGTDLAGDEEKFDLWYSQDNREFRLAIEFTAGTQVAQPDMIVEAKEA